VLEKEEIKEENVLIEDAGEYTLLIVPLKNSEITLDEFLPMKQRSTIEIDRL